MFSYVKIIKGFYKIVKKYDKVLDLDTLNIQSFASSEEPADMTERIANVVSRDKLIEWERFATEKATKSRDVLFPALRPWGVIFSIIVFFFSAYVPLMPTADLAARKCLSILLVAMSLWITEAIPYFATAMIIPPLVVFMDVLKDPSQPGRNLSSEQSAQFVLGHMFNHTTVSIIKYDLRCGFLLMFDIFRCYCLAVIPYLVLFHVVNWSCVCQLGYKNDVETIPGYSYWR